MLGPPNVLRKFQKKIVLGNSEPPAKGRLRPTRDKAVSGGLTVVDTLLALSHRPRLQWHIARNAYSIPVLAYLFVWV